MDQPKCRYFVLYKPRGIVSQFVSPDPVGLLGDVDFDFPAGTHAIGRLDGDSEGLLLLTTDKRITKLLFESKTPHERRYMVKVHGIVSGETLQNLRTGVSIRISGDEYWTTSPCKADIVPDPQFLLPQLEEQPYLGPSTWLSITLTEGKFRQVRKMTMATGHRVLRLIRLSIEEIDLIGLLPGQLREYNEEHFFKSLRLAGDTLSI